MKTGVWAAGFVMVVMAVMPASADKLVKGECFLSVKGKTYTDGPCVIAMYPGGSFTQGTGRDPLYWGTIGTPRNGWAGGSWTGAADPGARHAHDSLGMLKQQGGCWVNAQARLCAWKAGTRPRS